MFSRAVHGWAVMSTNVGHEDATGGLSWAANNQSLQIDWAWRAMASSVPYAKAIVAAYYQNVPAVGNHYSGCSTGGRQGIRQVEVDANSFDGMLIGAPAWNVRSAMAVLSRIG
jgi:feruloyl esterase